MIENCTVLSYVFVMFSGIGTLKCRTNLYVLLSNLSNKNDIKIFFMFKLSLNPFNNC